MPPPQVVFGGPTMGLEFVALKSVEEFLAALKKFDVLQIDTAAKYSPGKYGKSESYLVTYMLLRKGSQLALRS
jgi:hypothetical protein